MKRMLQVILSLVVSEFTLIMNSCAPEACLEETNSLLKASLYNYATKKKESPDSLTLYGINHETNKLYDKTAGVQPVFFPLDQSADNCSFIIRINGVADTITFRYTANPYLISMECGYTFNFNIIDTPFYTRNSIDSIFTAKRKITTLNEENMRIFY
jgi:Family of unknown function (DUF6452)